MRTLVAIAALTLAAGIGLTSANANASTPAAAPTHSSRITATNATPEPAVYGTKIRVVGYIDTSPSATTPCCENQVFTPLAGASVDLERKYVGTTTWATIATATSDTSGRLNATTTATRDAAYRWHYNGAGDNAPTTGPADKVDVIEPARYASCVKLNRIYPAGVGRKTSTQPGNWAHDTTTYRLNTARDRDHDGVACERAGTGNPKAGKALPLRVAVRPTTAPTPSPTPTSTNGAGGGGGSNG